MIITMLASLSPHIILIFVAMIPFKISSPSNFHFPFLSPDCVQRSACLLRDGSSRAEVWAVKAPRENPICMVTEPICEGSVLGQPHCFIIFSLFSLTEVSPRCIGVANSR